MLLVSVFTQKSDFQELITEVKLDMAVCDNTKSCWQHYVTDLRCRPVFSS